jgi:signal-transduction protein with cAMP-binding, CBS, and nucleotidyltransferase domain
MDVPLPSPAFDLYHHDPIQEAADAALTIDQLVDRIRLSPVFSELGETDVRELAESAIAQRFRRGEIVLAAGAASREVFVLWSGRARITIPDEPNVFIELSDGDVFGVVSRSRDRAASQEVVAVTDCDVVRIEASTAGAVASRNPSLADELNQLMSSRNRRLDPHAGRFDIEAPVPDSSSRESDEALQLREVDAVDAGSEGDPPS